MSLNILCQMLGWCTLANYLILSFWFLIFVAFREPLYRFHGLWFRIPPERFDTIHYAAMAFYKITVLVLNFVPYLALRIYLGN